MNSHNDALEQAASASRPWQRAHRRHTRSGGPRPVTRPPLLTASVGRHSRRRLGPGILFPILVYSFAPAGGISPRVASAQEVCFWEADLRPDKVVPPTASGGRGQVFAHFDEPDAWCPAGDGSDVLVIDPISYDQLQGVPTGASIHRGEEGGNGELLLTIATTGFPSGSQFAIPCNPTWDVFRDAVYVVLSTDLYPEGELRGQLLMHVTPVSNYTWGVVRAMYR